MKTDAELANDVRRLLNETNLLTVCTCPLRPGPTSHGAGGEPSHGCVVCRQLREAEDTAATLVGRLEARAGGDEASAPGYERLVEVLDAALDQAAKGKGQERHSTGQPFHEQPIVSLQRLYGRGYAFGQVAKKMEEAQRLPAEAARAELLGAINYLAAAVIHLREEDEA